jgi:hypothetical protein
MVEEMLAVRDRAGGVVLDAIVQNQRNGTP